MCNKINLPVKETCLQKLKLSGVTACLVVLSGRVEVTDVERGFGVLNLETCQKYLRKTYLLWGLFSYCIT